jgi:hypothetical protein
MASLQRGGSPLSSRERDFFEPRLGRNLSQVRIHHDAVAAESARSFHAQAYTTRHHIVFAAGRYASQTPAGLRLLAHELAHVAQQSGGAPGTVQRWPDDALISRTPDPTPPKTGPQPDKKNCPEELRKELKKEVDKQCREVEEGTKKCTMQGDDCESVTEKLAYYNRCLDAREKMQRTCFRKGDAEYEGHMLQISQVYTALRRCEGVEQEKCKPGKDPRIAPKD